MIKYLILNKISLFIIVLFLAHTGLAQFKGGADDGCSVAKATNVSLGMNVFKGGVDDGHDVSKTSNAPLGVNIFKGGVDDGGDVSKLSSAPLGVNIFKGGVDDGGDVSKLSSASLGVNIFKGGVDDGSDVNKLSNTSLGANIFKGGADDGWAMAFSGRLALPVTLTSFTGNWLKNDAVLKWQTTAEINLAYYELERSFDSRTFTAIQNVPAAGHTSNNYTYTDVNVKNLLTSSSTTVYYRLKYYNKDGSYQYSGIVLLKAIEGEMAFSIFPNPAQYLVNVQVTNYPVNEQAYIRLTDANGKIVITQKVASFPQQLNVSSFASGIYFLQVIGKNNVLYTQKIIISK